LIGLTFFLNSGLDLRGPPAANAGGTRTSLISVASKLEEDLALCEREKGEGEVENWMKQREKIKSK
jgi:hypothetical protein